MLGDNGLIVERTGAGVQLVEGEFDMLLAFDGLPSPLWNRLADAEYGRCQARVLASFCQLPHHSVRSPCASSVPFPAAHWGVTSKSDLWDFFNLPMAVLGRRSPKTCVAATKRRRASAQGATWGLGSTRQIFNLAEGRSCSSRCVPQNLPSKIH